MWGWSWLETLLQDVRYGLRQLRRNPGFTAVAVITLALGIGANTAIFSLIDAVLLTALPVRNPQQLVLLNWASNSWPKGIVKGLAGSWYTDRDGRVTSTSFSYPIYERIRTRNHVLSRVAALAGNGCELAVGYNGQPGRADGEFVSGTFFSTIEVQPVLGRTLTPDDDRAGASPAAVISYGYWQRRFGRDPGIVGRTITVNRIPFTIVGVSSPEFYGVQPGRSVDAWLPLHSQPQVEPRWSPKLPDSRKAAGARAGSLFEARDDWWVVIVGRLKAGVTGQQARAALGVVFQQSIAAYSKLSTKPESVPHLEIEPGSKGLDYLRREFSKPLFILMTVVALVLLIACANVASLLLARATSRRKEIAMRMAIGAGRRRLIRQLLTESVLLAALGGTVGLLLAFWVTKVLVAFVASGRERLTLTVTPDVRVLVFTAAASILTGILFGFSPALRSVRIDLTAALKESPGKRFARSGRRRWRLDAVLVAAQVALSTVLLVGAVQFVRTLTNLESVNAGFNTRRLLLFGIDPTQDGYKGQRLADFYADLSRRLAALPGVRSVSLSHSTLIGGGGNFERIYLQGYTPRPGEQVGAAIDWVGPNFFKTLGIPLLLGRAIVESDTMRGPKVVVVNEQFVKEFLGGENPIGRRFRLGGRHGEETQIVGVAGDAKYFDLRRKDPATIYAPWVQYPDLNGAMNFELRTAGEPMQMASAVLRVIRDTDRNLAPYDLKSEEEQIDQSLFQERLFARLTSLSGALAALLACVGIYGVMAFTVTQRTREIGIRMALGATKGQVAGAILRESCVVVGLGMVIGIAVALGASRLVSSMLYGLKPDDPLTLAVAATIMLGAAAFATYGPARRAAKVDPMVALRYE